jgi:hypothetical protein
LIARIADAIAVAALHNDALDLPVVLVIGGAFTVSLHAACR